MLCFSVVVRRLNSYFKGVFPLLYEQVESNVWIHFLQNFLVGNIVTMFLVSIMVIYFELSSMTLRKTAGIAAAGGLLSAWSDGFLCMVLLLGLDMLGSLGRKLITLFVIYVIVSNIDELQQAGSEEANSSGSLPFVMDFKANEFQAYKLLQPISSLFTEECEARVKGLLKFCEDFEGSNTVMLTTEFYKTKEMCIKLRKNYQLAPGAEKACQLDELTMLKNETFHEELLNVYSDIQAHFRDSKQDLFWNRTRNETGYSLPRLDNMMGSVKTGLGILRYFVILLGFIEAFYYFWSYTHYLDFDNIYVTYLFETVDRHRRTQKMEYVLPIKSFEKDKYISPYAIFWTREEKMHAYSTTAVLLFEVSIVYIFLAVLKIHAAHVAELEVSQSVRSLHSFVQQGSMDIFRRSQLPFHLAFIDYFSIIYLMIFLLSYHSVYTKRFRSVVCGLIYTHIEESRAMALYHTILVQRQDLFDIRYSLLLDRLAYEDSAEAKADFLFGFGWWERLSGAYDGWMKYLHTNIVARIYEYCALCGDYEYWYTKNLRYKKCPVEGCELVYCLDCVTYLGKRCVREGHDAEGEAEDRPDGEKMAAHHSDAEEGSHSHSRNHNKRNNQQPPAEDQNQQRHHSHKEAQKPHHHRRNKSHHGVLE